MLDRSKIWSMDQFLLRPDPNDTDFIRKIEDAGILWATGGYFRHTGFFDGMGGIYEQNPPFPKQKSLADTGYDDLFDRGLLCHIRHNGSTPEIILRKQGWVDGHLGPKYPYGFESIGLYAIEGAFDHILPALAPYLKSLRNPVDFEHEPVCSVFTWLADVYAFQKNFAAVWGIGDGGIVPSDYGRMIPEDFTVIQDRFPEEWWKHPLSRPS